MGSRDQRERMRLQGEEMGEAKRRGGERVPGIREGWGRSPAPRNLGGTFLWRERVRAVQPQKESLRSRWGGEGGLWQ